MHAGHPSTPEKFDLKHDSGGLVDTEFAVQYLVLAHAAREPKLALNSGNIALLDAAVGAHLLDETLAREAQEAYRKLRRTQHALKLAGADKACVAPLEFTAARDAIRALYRTVLENATPPPH
jgi:[glutamine synthetase] adenylyltransferase / [glutamine synthetase]-adenylyl-L-tyrosine phosphorylase